MLLLGELNESHMAVVTPLSGCRQAREMGDYQA
jgi:hypothetical protein